jgi:hypothetical protein
LENLKFKIDKNESFYVIWRLEQKFWIQQKIIMTLSKLSKVQLICMLICETLCNITLKTARQETLW